MRISKQLLVYMVTFQHKGVVHKLREQVRGGGVSKMFTLLYNPYLEKGV